MGRLNPSERLIATCETRSDAYTLPGRLILVERVDRFGPGRSEFVVWWEELKGGAPAGRAWGFYSESRFAAQRNFAERVEGEAWYWRTAAEVAADQVDQGRAS